MNTEKNRRTNKKIILALAVIILLQLARLIYVFTVEKTGGHSDEIWGYGLANSYYKPYIYMTNDESEETYDNQWVSSEILWDYITVGEEERFAYDSVISNMKIDSHPPLYYLFIHTISSIFPGTYSLWYGFFINLVCFVVMQIFIYKLGKLLTGSDGWSLLMVAFFGFSVGALNMTIFVRQYAMVTMFTVMTMYYHARLLFAKEKKSFRNDLIKLALAVFGGSMTHYFYIVFVFMLAACYFIYYSCKKKGGRLLAYSLTMLGAVLVTIPFTGVGEFMGLGAGVDRSGGGEVVTVSSGIASAIIGMVSGITDILYDPDFDLNVNIVLKCVLYDNFGFAGELSLPYWLLHACVLGAFFAVVFVCAAMFIAAKSKDVDGRMYKLSVKISLWIKTLSDYRFLLFAFALAVAFQHYMVIGYSKPYVMGNYTDRYIFLTYPAIMILTVLVIKKIVSIIAKKVDRVQNIKSFAIRSTACLLIIISICNNLRTDCIYLFPRNESEPSLEDVVKDKDVVLSLTLHWLLTVYCDILSDAQSVFVTDINDVYDYEKEIQEYDTEELILLVDAEDFYPVASRRHDCELDEVTREMVEECYMEFYEQVYDGKKIEFVLEDDIFKRNIMVYRVF